MMKFPIAPGRAIYIIEPANLKKLKKGEMLILDRNLVAFTPDIQKFAAALNVPDPTKVERGERIEVDIMLTVDKLIDALKECQALPEVDRE